MAKEFVKWDLTKGALTVNGLPIVGFQEGDLIAAEHSNVKHSTHMSADNYGRHAKNPNKNGTIAIGLSGNSPAMTMIQALVDADEPVAIAYKDFTAESSFVNAINCVLEKDPAFTRAMEIADVVWPFTTTSLDYKHSTPLRQV